MIKALELQDISLMREVMEEDGMTFDEAYLRKFLEDKNNHGFIIKADHKIVGFAYAYDLPRPDNQNMLYIHSIGILKGYRDKGLGTKLVAYILDYAKSNGYLESWVITDKGNPRACHLYEKLGGRSDYDDEIVYVFDFEKPDV